MGRPYRLKMKVTLVLVALGAAMATVFAGHGDLSDLINKEVGVIVGNEPSLTQDQCADKCDAIFLMVSAHDESGTDKICLNACKHALGITKPPHAPHRRALIRRKHVTSPGHPGSASVRVRLGRMQ